MSQKAPAFAPAPAPIPKVSVVLPSYRLHKASGKAVVTLGGRDVYLGAHGSPESQAEYRRVLAEWLVSGQLGAVNAAGAESDLNIARLMLAFWRHAERAYPPKSLQTIRQALSHLRSMYGHTLVRDFRPLCIRAIQQSLIDAVDEKGNKVYCRRTINHYCAEVRHVFKWGVGEGLVPATVWHGLQAVGGLRRGRSQARESEPIRPVCDADVESALSHVTPVIADMVRVQRLTGARPSEVCKMTVGEIDTTGSVWMYVPREHKTAHHGKSRVICIGPRAQAVLRGYLRPDLAAALFSPRESEMFRKAAILQPMGPVMFVFDVSDTEPIPGKEHLPAPVEDPFGVRGGRIGGELATAIENAVRDGVRVENTKIFGAQVGGRIEAYAGPPKKLPFTVGRKPPRTAFIPLRYDVQLNADGNAETRYASLVHELGHLYCGHLGTPDDRWWPDRSNKDIVIREFEAEAVSHLLCKRLGLDSPSDSYLSGYLNGHQELPAISMDTVFRAAGLIDTMGRRRLGLRGGRGTEDNAAARLF